MSFGNLPRHRRALRRAPVRGRWDLLPALETLEVRSLLSYAITDLGTLGGSVSEALGLNDNGQVVGESRTGAVDQYGKPVTHGFIWDSSHGMRDVGTFNSDLNSVAVGINDAGTVAGSSSTAPVLKVDKKTGYSYYVSTDHAVTWSSALKARKLGDGFALAINGVGEVVGSSNNNAVLWSGGGATNLGTLGGTGNQSVASGINGAGQVVGSAPVNDIDQTQRAFLWTPTTPDGTKGTMRSLGELDPSPGAGSSGRSINAIGETAGTSAYLGLPYAALFAGGSVYNLGTLGGTDNASSASSINASGVVVGTAFDESGTTTADRAWIWAPTSPNGTSGQMIDLNS